MPLDPPMPLDIAHSVCPHDCPSTCALEVERLDARTIGRVHGGRKDGYTAGVVWAKGARVAQPLRRIGPRGVGGAAFEPIGWDEALDTVADRFAEAARRFGPETVW